MYNAGLSSSAAVEEGVPQRCQLWALGVIEGEPAHCQAQGADGKEDEDKL